GLPFAMLTNGLNWLLIELPRLFTSFDAASFRVPIFPGYGKTIYLVYFLPIIAAAAIMYRWQPFALKPPPRGATWSFAAVSIFCLSLGSLIVLHPFSQPRPDGYLKVEFLDVGQGDSAFVTFPNGGTMLIDGGGRVNFGSDDVDVPVFEPDVPRIGEMVVSEFLWEKGYSHVDRLVVSHADADHSQGLGDVVRNFSVGEIWIGSEAGEKSEMAELIAGAQRFSVQVIRVGRGASFEIGGVTIEVLWPDKTASQTGSNNNSSLVIRMTFGEASFLFTGDIEREAEEALASNAANLDADVIKVPHHGSRTSSTKPFIDAISAEIAIIPVGKRSLYGHPHKEVVERWKQAGVEVRSTGEKGTVTVTTNGKGLDIRTHKD
ncbi:MAG TPA: ComEC/Rec2 family competence protein, partial [Pyrinomonadaceae bacterium]